MKFRICWNIGLYLVVTKLIAVSKKIPLCENVLLLTKYWQGKASSVMIESPLKNRKKNTLRIAKNYEPAGLTFQSLVYLSQVSDLWAVEQTKQIISSIRSFMFSFKVVEILEHLPWMYEYLIQA